MDLNLCALRTVSQTVSRKQALSENNCGKDFGKAVNDIIRDR